MVELDRLCLEYPTWGVMKLRDHFNHADRKIAPKHLRRLLRKLGIIAIYRKPNLSRKNREHSVYPYLLRGLTISRPNQVWCADITYRPMQKGFVYLVAIMDWNSRYVLSWELSNTLDADFCVKALRKAIVNYGSPEIMNTDQGAQFTSEAWIQVLNKYGIKISMDGQGRALDNVIIERLWRSVKYDEVYLNPYVSVWAAEAGLNRYLKHYNESRPHSSLNGNTPAETYFETLPQAICQ